MMNIQATTSKQHPPHLTWSSVKKRLPWQRRGGPLGHTCYCLWVRQRRRVSIGLFTKRQGSPSTVCIERSSRWSVPGHTSYEFRKSEPWNIMEHWAINDDGRFWWTILEHWWPFRVYFWVIFILLPPTNGSWTLGYGFGTAGILAKTSSEIRWRLSWNLTRTFRW